MLPPLPLEPLCVAPSEVMTEVALLNVVPVEVAVLLRDVVLQYRVREVCQPVREKL